MNKKLDLQRFSGDDIMSEAVEAGTILVVNDQRLPLMLVVKTLKMANFLVLQADSEASALKVAANYAGRIDLLLADFQLAAVARLSFTEGLRKTRPDTSVMLTCGDILISSYGCALIHNPFMPLKMLEMIDAVLHPAEKSDFACKLSAGSSA
jgi:PleD family two-component response regulator